MGVLFTFAVVGAMALALGCVCAVVEHMRNKADAQVERRVAQVRSVWCRRKTDGIYNCPSLLPEDYYREYGKDAWPVYKEGQE